MLRAALGSAPIVKRIRVRLKAESPEDLRRTFAHRLQFDGVLLPARWSLAVGEPVEVQLSYRDRVIALQGRGRVAELRSGRPGSSSPKDVWIELDWSPDSSAQLQAILQPTSSLTSSPMFSRSQSDQTTHEVDRPAEANAPLVSTKTAPDAADGLDTGPPDSEGSLASSMRSAADLPLPVPRPLPVDATADVLMSGLDLEPPFGGPSADFPPGLGPEVEGSELDPERDTGEVTPLARIELVRRSRDSVDLGGAVAPIAGEGPTSGLEEGPARVAPKGRHVLGVDLGSDVTRIAVEIDGELRPVPTRRGLSTLPTVVHADPRGKTFVGEAAVRRAESDPLHGVRDFRRLMGRAFDAPGVRRLAERCSFRVVAGPQGETAVALDPDTVVPLEEVAGVLFKEVREGSSFALTDRANRAVVTVPSWSGPQLRDSVRLAAELGGLHVERLVGEASAVALDWATKNPVDRGTSLVVSLGAGLLDLALVDTSGGRVHVRRVGGTFDVGGFDFDRALEPLFIEAVEDATGIRPAETPDFWARLFTTCRIVKESLSDTDRTTGALMQPLPDGQAFRLELDVTRAMAEPLWAPVADRMQSELEAFLEQADFDHVERVLAAGAQLRMPLLKDRIRSLLPSAHWIEMEPDAAARGAALLGRRSAHGELPGLTEVSSRALAVASKGVEARLLFLAGKAMPASRDLVIELGPEPELVLLQSGLLDGGWMAVGRLDIAEPGVERVSLRVSLAADGQLGILGEVPGADWRPVGLEPVLEPEREASWWSTLPLPADEGDGTTDERRGFVGWLKRRFRPR